jgi:phage terminase large subunit GpA-like protein
MSLASLLSARSVTREVAEIIRPSRRLSPDEAVEQYLRSAGGPWQRELAPMMIEPLNLLGSRLYTGIVFIGPSRTSKTFSLVIGGITYVVTCSPADTLVVHNTEAKARAFSRYAIRRSWSRDCRRVRATTTSSTSFSARAWCCSFPGRARRSWRVTRTSTCSFQTMTAPRIATT